MSSAENDNPTGRLVWISAEMIANAWLGDVTGDDLIRARDAAPADPAEAIATFLLDWDYGQPDFSQASPLMQAEYLSLAAIVLRALGVPPEREA